VQLGQAGADAVVTMMPDEEMARLGVPALPEVVGQNGMAWFQFPVEDDAAPDEAFERAWQANKSEVLSLIRQERCVAIHCRGGSGRTGFMAAIILRELGIDADDVANRVKSLRPNSLKLAAHTDYLSTHYDMNNKQETS